MNPKKISITIEGFDPFDTSNIQCIYNLGAGHVDKPVYEQCERCFMVNGTVAPLCSGCGYFFEGMRVCNDCYSEIDGQREHKWTNTP